MTYLATRLQDFVGPSEWNQKPFRLDIGSVRWSVATDRKWVVAMRGGDFEPIEGPPDKLARITEILKAPVPDDRVAISVAELAKWCADVIQVATDKETGHAPFSLLGVPVNAVRVAKMLDGLLFQKIAVWNSTSLLGEKSVGMTVAGGWIAYLAGLDLEAVDLPVFEIKVAKKRRKRS